MSGFLLKDATVTLTEITVNELKRAIDKAKAEGAQKVLVKSEYSPIKFLIAVENQPHSMESMGYRGETIKESEIKGNPIPMSDEE